MAARKLTRKDLAEAAERYKNWGCWGSSDEIGTLNHAPAGAQKCGIEKTKAKMVGRGVFLDVPRALGKSTLEDGYGITCADLTATKQGVRVGRGDFVIVRTGQMETKLDAGSWDGLTFEPIGGTPQQFADVRSEVAKWAVVVKQTGAKLE